MLQFSLGDIIGRTLEDKYITQHDQITLKLCMMTVLDVLEHFIILNQLLNLYQFCH